MLCMRVGVDQSRGRLLLQESTKEPHCEQLRHEIQAVL